MTWIDLRQDVEDLFASLQVETPPETPLRDQRLGFNRLDRRLYVDRKAKRRAKYLRQKSAPAPSRRLYADAKEKRRAKYIRNRAKELAAQRGRDMSRQRTHLPGYPCSDRATGPVSDAPTCKRCEKIRLTAAADAFLAKRAARRAAEAGT